MSNTIPIILVALLLQACASDRSASGPYDTDTPAARNPAQARELTEEGVSLIETNPQRAEELFREALMADLYHGPAHNNLGVLYLQDSRFYEAANEFEWARKLMPGHPDPRLNLALTLERAGRLDEAFRTYDTALEVYSEHIPTIQAQARLAMRTNRDDERLAGWLDLITIRGETEQWRSWAREQRLRLDGGSGDAGQAEGLRQ